MTYIATFYTHFGAITFQKRLEKMGDKTAKLIAAPRAVSVSCGTSVSFTMPFDRDTMPDEDTEAIYILENDEFHKIYSND